MTNSSLVEYVRSNLVRGVKLASVREKLIKSGWPKEEVFDAISKNKHLVGIPSHRIPIRFPARPTAPPMAQQQLAQPTVKKDNSVSFFSNKGNLILVGGVVLGVMIVVLLLFWFMGRPVCGNGEIEKGETRDNCCLDAGCLGEQLCEGGMCTDPECGECQYIDNHKCKDYQCCDDSKCGTDEECIDNKCSTLDCGECTYGENHKCKDATCCTDTDCNDDNTLTEDKCSNPGIKTASCSNVIPDACSSDVSCDDDDVSTHDTCSGTPKVCVNSLITACVPDDSYCPSGCTHDDDNDCEQFYVCTEWDCFVNASKDCDAASFEAESKIDISGMEIELEIFYEILGMDGSKCELYYKVQDYDIDFSSDFKDYLLSGNASIDDDNVTSSEFDDRVNDLEDEFSYEVDKYTNCLFFKNIT